MNLIYRNVFLFRLIKPLLTGISKTMLISDTNWEKPFTNYLLEAHLLLLNEIIITISLINL